MTASRAEQAALRREGIADAAVLLVAHRRFPTLELADWGEFLGLDRLELQAAVARFRALAEDRRRAQLRSIPGGRSGRRGPARPTKYSQADDGTWPCPVDGCDVTYTDGRGLASHVRTHETIECECGRTINKGGIGPHRRFCTGAPA